MLVFYFRKGFGSGGSEDWAKGVANIKYSYCFELRPAQYGVDSEYGFALPENRYILLYDRYYFFRLVFYCCVLLLFVRVSLAGEETYRGIKDMLISIKTSI